MHRHPTLDGRHPEFRTCHSSPVSRHFPLCLAFAALLAANAGAAPKVVYVAPGGTGDGSSWENAMGSVADAYAAAAAYAEGGFDSGEVWIKTGRYTIPSSITAQSGVSVFGGFLGTETDASQGRRENLTILSGDKGDNDYWMPCSTNTAEKLYVWTGEDKMTFNPPDPHDPDEYWTLSNGGSGNYLYCFLTRAANPPVTNCTFSGLTFTSFQTCPVYLFDGGPHVGMAVTNCNFWACSDGGYGAVLLSAAEARLSDNVCWGGRARIRIKTPETVACTNEIARCVFRDNTINGGLYLEAGTTNNTWRVTECTFYRNRAESNGAAVHLANNMQWTRLEMRGCSARKCILTGTSLGLVSTASGGTAFTLLFTDCDFEGNICTNSTLGHASACFTGCSQGKSWFFDGCSFRGNRIWYGGTGNAASVYSSYAANQFTTFLNCSFEDNAAVSTGETPAASAATLALPLNNTRLYVVNSLLDGNACSGARTNADLHIGGPFNQAFFAVVNSVLHSDDPGYVPLRSGLSPYLFKASMSNLDTNAVGCAAWTRLDGVSSGVDPAIAAKLRAKAGCPHRMRGLWVDSPFWRGGTDIWVRPRPGSFPHVLLRDPEFHKSSSRYWHPINFGPGGGGELDQTDATMASLGLTKDSPLHPDALGNPRKAGKVAYGPIGYAHPAVMKVR